MTVGRTEEICVGRRKEGREGDMKRPLTFTALSTIAVQSGQTQIVVSVLKSGSSVHLQLVHVEPGLCEIGSDQVENQTLIQEQKQLLEKLKKHEGEVLSSIDKRRVEQRRQRRDDWLCGQRSPREDQEGVYRAMESSLREGWTLLLRLLDRRLHTLRLTADFYHTVKEFALGIERLEDLQIKPGRLNDAQLMYISIRRDLLGKSLQLLGISSDLVRKLRELQKTEALQRQGEVLQEEDDEDQESSQCSWGTVLRLEQVVEALQDRRRAVDQEVKLQIQQAQNDTQACLGEQGAVERQEWSLEEILSQNLSFPPEAESDLQSTSEEAGKSPEQPLESSNSTDTDDNKFTSNSSLVSASSHEALDLQTALKQEQQLRVESRTEDREPTPTMGFEETQEASDEDASTKSLASLSDDREDSMQEFELEEFINFEAEPEIELQYLKSESGELCSKSSLHIDVHSEFKLDEETDDVPTERESDEASRVRSPSNHARIQHSGTKLKVHGRSSPIFNLASLEIQSELRETKHLVFTTDDSFTKNELKQDYEDSESNEKPHLHLAMDSTLQEFEVVENGTLQQKSRKFEAKLHSQLPKSKPNLNEMEDLNFEINLNTDKDSLPKINQSSNGNLMTISASKQGLEHRSRSLPVFNLVSKKLQPKLQETKDLLNITTNETSAGFEGKPESKLVKSSNITQTQTKSQSNGYKTMQEANVAVDVKQAEISENRELENGPDLNNVPNIGEVKELYISSSLNDIADVDVISDQETHDMSNEKTASTASLESELTPTEQDAPVKTPESFSERFKKLQSKWQEKEDVTLKPQIKSCKVKNQNAVPRNISKEHLNKAAISEELNQWEIKDIVDVQRNIEDTSTVMPLTCEERLVHETEVKPSVETVVRVESTTVKKYEVTFDHSTSELKQEEDRRRHLEEIEKLHSSCDQLADKVCLWLDHCSCHLSVSSNPGLSLSEAQHSLNTNITLQSEAQAVREDAESMVQILDQLRVLCPASSDDSSVSSLRALTHQLKRSSTEACSDRWVLNSDLAARVEVIMKHLNTVNTTILSNLLRLQPYVSFLQTAEEAKADFEHLKQGYSEKLEMEETVEEARWRTAQQKFLTTTELGNNFIRDLCKVTEIGPHLESMVREVMETMDHLNEAKEKVEELHRHYQTRMQKLRDDKEYCLKYKERLEKTVKDLQCVSELLDSCTVIDLGSEQHTSRLLQQFTQARPHFTQLDAEANFITSNFETLRRLQKRHGPLIAETVTEEDVSALLDLHLRLKQKIEESESILELSSSFHFSIKQLEDHLRSNPLTSPQGRCAEEKLNLLKVEKEQIHNLFNRASNLKTDLCDGVKNSSVCGLRVQQLEACLQSVDSQRAAWLREAARCEDKVLREMKTQALLHDIHLLRDSFKDLKKRFSNLKINYLKRNDRSRNIKAVRNQLQQVDTYEDKLQSLKTRLQALTARLQSEVKDGGSSRELEDLLNELRRQMGECDRSIKEHHKTLDMTCSLQEAMDEYQLWCEEASGTIARVGKFSAECRSTEAVTVLYRQFEKFVWPTVPQQEERISQISELAVRLHGADEGRRYIEKTVSKHSEMVAAIRALSDGLLELEAKLKLESLKQQQKDEEQVKSEDGQMEKSSKEKEEGKSMNEIKDEEKSQQVDNRAAQEAAEMYELKETGHTPELTNKHDGKETLTRRHSFSKKPPLQKHRTHQETDRQASSSFCSTHTFSLNASSLETNRQVYAIISQSQPAVSQTSPSPREVHKAKREDTLNTTQDSGAGGIFDSDLHSHHEVLSEDSLSTDEYECPSPDDISLPPLAETPESILVPSDLEEGVCFGSQHSYRSHVQSEHRESSETNQHSVSRFRTESGTFVPSPLTVPIQTQVQAEFITSVHTITTEATTIPPEHTNRDNIPDQPSRNTDLIPPAQTPSVKINLPTSSTSLFEELPLLQSDNSLPKSFPVCQSSLHQEVTSFEMTNLRSKENKLENSATSQSDPVLEDIVADIKLPKFDVPSLTLCNNDPTTIFHKNQLQDLSNELEHNITSTTTIRKATVYSQSCVSSRSLVKAAPEKDDLDSVHPLHQEETEDLKSTGKSDQDLPSQGNALHKQSKDCEDEVARQKKCLTEAPRSNSFDENLASPQELSDPSTTESASLSRLNPSCNPSSSNGNNIVNIKQNHQTVCPETPTEQCVHDPGFSAQPGPPPLPEAQTQALAQRANTHATPPHTSPHLLTPDQDPDICQPCTIREEIRLTPQIKGPSVPPQAQEECSSFTRPVSKAAVMGGSPVTLEVEVTGQPEPTLTWCIHDIEEEEQVREENQRHEEGKAMDGAVCEAWLAAAGAKERKGNSNDEGEDRGLVAEMYDIMMADWQTWFGTLCFLLWLLFLIII